MLKAGSVKDQRLPNCTACAVVSAVEAMQPGFVGSVSFVYHNLHGVQAREGGLKVWDALQSVHRYGVCPEALWPSSPDNDGKRPHLAAYKDAQKRRIRIPAPLLGAKDAIGWLGGGRPLVFSYESELLVRMGLHRPEDQQGWHTSAVMGYKASQKAFLVLNSWGEQWGEEGKFWMPEDIFNNGTTCRNRFGVSL